MFTIFCPDTFDLYSIFIALRLNSVYFVVDEIDVEDAEKHLSRESGNVEESSEEEDEVKEKPKGKGKKKKEKAKSKAVKAKGVSFGQKTRKSNGELDEAPTSGHLFCYDFVESHFENHENDRKMINQQIDHFEKIVHAFHSRNDLCWKNIGGSTRFDRDSSYAEKMKFLWLLKQLLVPPLGEYIVKPLDPFFNFFCDCIIFTVLHRRILSLHIFSVCMFLFLCRCIFAKVGFS